MQVISSEEEKIVVQIRRFLWGWDDFYQDFIYTFQLDENGNIIIIDLEEV